MSNSRLLLRQIVVGVLYLGALYVVFLIYQSGHALVALIVLIAVCSGIYIYTARRAYTYRYLYPGLLGFSIFVILPLLYTVYVSFTRYNAGNRVTFDRRVELLKAERLLPSKDSFSYELHRDDRGNFRLLLTSTHDDREKYLSEPFPLIANADDGPNADPVKLQSYSDPAPVTGKLYTFKEVARDGLYRPLRGRKFLLPDNRVVAYASLREFADFEALWVANPDGSYTSKANGRKIRPDFKTGYFMNPEQENWGPGFRVFAGFENYLRVFLDPRIQGPFFRVFLWNFFFALLSVLGTLAVGMFLAVLLEWKEVRFRRFYRTFLILPYAVPSILSILIFRGLFDQEFGPINLLIRSVVGLAPEWQTNPWNARLMILIVNIWLSYPYLMLVCTGMLQSVPESIYEASAIDGSNPINDFFKLTLPLVMRPLLPILVASFAFNFNNFALIYLLTAGAPKMVGGGLAGQTDILVTYTFNLAFRDTGSDYGLASALATLLFFIIGGLAWANLRLTRRSKRLKEAGV